MFSEPLQRFVDCTPVCVMIRMAMERTLAAEALDELFRRAARQQYQRELLFSSVVGLMIPVVCGGRRSVHEAYQHSPQGLAVSLTSIYNKLGGIETGVCGELVDHCARQVQNLVHQLRQDRPSLLPGRPIRIVDGDHLAGSEHRLAETRTLRAAVLPGQALVVLDPVSRLILQVVSCENAHTQERALVEPLLQSVQAGQVWIADRNFCTTRMLFGVAGRGALFLIRQHASTLRWRPLEEFSRCGRADSGRVSQQRIQIEDQLSGQRLEIRRVRLELDEPTTDGQTQILLLTNLAEQEASAKQVAEAYHRRWTIERAFEELAVSLRGEINTLGYPKAALFGFCVAVVAYNLVSLVKASLGAVHGRPTVEQEISGYHLAREWATTYVGMSVALGPAVWARYAGMDEQAFVQVLRALAEAMQLRKYRKAKRGPKKKRPPRTSGKRIHHVATAKLLAMRKTGKMTP